MSTPTHFSPSQEGSASNEAIDRESSPVESYDCGHTFRSRVTDATRTAARIGATGLRVIASVPKLFFLGIIRFYQKFISPMTPASCRFYPSCSQYAVTALQTHGLLRGTWLAVRRLSRCHPWNPGGVDHVPPRRGSSPEAAASPRPSVSERNN